MPYPNDDPLPCALDRLLNQCEILQAALEAFSVDSNDKKILATISDFLRRLQEFNSYFCLLLSHAIFEKTDILSKQIQKKTVSTGEGITLCQFTKQQLSLMRYMYDDFFNQLWEIVKVVKVAYNSLFLS